MMVAAILCIFAYWKISQHIGFNNSSFGMFCQISSVCLYEPSTNGLGGLILRIPAGPKFLSTTIYGRQEKIWLFWYFFQIQFVARSFAMHKMARPITERLPHFSLNGFGWESCELNYIVCYARNLFTSHHVTNVTLYTLLHSVAYWEYWYVSFLAMQMY